VAYPLGVEGVVVGEGDSYDEALADVKSALGVYVETFEPGALEASDEVLEVFLAETAVGT
jgi:predicted RNase H-like HicB family nuclease